jgi:uncharacterized damage-inducible protein DinB
VDVNQLLEAWRTNNRITLFLLDEISDEGLSCTLSRRGGRDVARQFAHLHDVRIYHLGERAPDLAKGLEQFQEKGRPAVSPDRETLKAALTESGEAMEAFLRGVVEGSDAGPRRRGFKKGIFTTLAYFVAHESHHRGSILLTLKQCGHGVDRNSAYRIWDWDRM